MSQPSFSIQRIDHVKVLVPDRYEAAKWYEQVLGLQILHSFPWDAAAAAPGGPLFLSNSEALDGTKIVLLEGEPLGDHAPIGITRASFSVDGTSFLRFLARLGELELFNETGERVTRDQIVDQWIAWSVFFSDPYGNRFEVLTYDYETVKKEQAP